MKGSVFSMASLLWIHSGWCLVICLFLGHQSLPAELDEEESRANSMMSNIDMEISTFTCGETTMAKEFHFVSPAYPVSVGMGNLTCQITIDHGCPGAGTKDSPEICQIRLDFEEFNIQPPLLGTCHYDKFYASANGKYPLLCGDNSGQHMYLDVSGRSTTDLTFILDELKSALYSCEDKFGMFESDPSLFDNTIMMRQLKNPAVNLGQIDNVTMLNFPTRRAWKAKVTQIPCGCAETSVKRAPDGCLQYYNGISGAIKSFNYDQVGCFSNDHICEPTNLESCDIYAGYTGQLNNLDYATCIEQEYGFCGTEFYQALEPGSFTLSNSTNLNENFQDPVVEGARTGDTCNSDYLLLPGGHCKNDKTHYSTDRFCGNTLGVGNLRQPIISYSRPFLFRVVTDKDEITSSIDYMNRGFHLKYHQLPCSTNI